MSKTLARSAASITAILLAAALAACSPTSTQTDPTTTDAGTMTEAEVAQSAALDRVVDESQAVIPELLAQYGDTYSDIRILGVHPGTYVYEYDYIAAVDPTLTAEALDEGISTLQEVCDDQIFPGLAAEGITINPQVVYTYYNADGSLVWTHTFTPSA